LPLLDQAEKIVRRFLPPTAERAEITVATIWLSQQAVPFIRHYDMLSKPPLKLKIDKRFIEQLAADLGRMAVAALNARDTSPPNSVPSWDVPSSDVARPLSKDQPTINV
jgi:hypothetical protein